MGEFGTVRSCAWLLAGLVVVRGFFHEGGVLHPGLHFVILVARVRLLALLNVANTPGPFRDRGEIAMAGLRLLPLRSMSGAVPCALCSDGPLSSRPQRMESGGHVTPRDDTREEHGLSFLNFQSPSGVAGWH